MFFASLVVALFRVTNTASSSISTAIILVSGQSFEAAKDKFPLVDNWENLRNDIVSHITNATTKTFRLNRVDGLRIEVTSVLLADGSFMIINKQVL